MPAPRRSIIFGHWQWLARCYSKLALALEPQDKGPISERSTVNRRLGAAHAHGSDTVPTGAEELKTHPYVRFCFALHAVLGPEATTERHLFVFLGPPSVYGPFFRPAGKPDDLFY